MSGARMLRQRTTGSSSTTSTSTTSIISDGLQVAEDNVKKALLLCWDELHPWQQDNSHILGSYRPASGSFLGSFLSLFYLHNEFVNIWSHLLGAVFLSASSIVLYNTFAPRYPSASKEDVIAFGCYFVGAAACLGMSATYHTISNHSLKVNRIGNKLDFIGIVCLIWGSFVPAIYYGLCGHPYLRGLYWTMISVLGVGCAAVSGMERFRTPAWRPYRAAMFVGMGISAVIPVLHGLELQGLEQMQRSMGLSWILLEGFLYILGAGLYAARFPERRWPGKFDIWGSSHQIFHFLVVAAATSHLVGLVKAFDYHHGVFGRGCWI